MGEEERSGSNRVSGERLRGFVERIERLVAEKSDVSDRITQVYAEAKSEGYAPPYMRAIIKLRKQKPSEREEHSAMMDLYMDALGMATDTPLFRHVQGMGVDIAARDKVLEALKLLAPETGDITVKAGKGPRIRIWRDKGGEVRTEEVVDAPAPKPRTDSPSVDRPGSDAPDCTEEEAHELGRLARREDQPVIANPFPYNDPRRQRWDQGWRDEDGGDGMGPR